MPRLQLRSHALPGLLTGLLSLACAAAAPPLSQEELEAWFNGNGATAVNEGDLTFLAASPAKPVHHHQNLIRITPASLRDGWVELEQCHDHLDAVPDAQITFRVGYIRNLQIVEARAITRAWVEGPSVQLKGVSPAARLCLKAQTRALRAAGSGYFELNNGPYMRKFLDGYYPMALSLRVEYPASLLKVVDIRPNQQPGFSIRENPGQVSIEALFEGVLRTMIQFQQLH